MSTMIYNGKRVGKLAMQFLQQEQADWSQTDATAPDYIKNKPAIDSTYDPASGNPQSGIAVAEAIDRLCPPLKASGETVICHPAEDSPLVITAAADTTVKRCGKNLWSLGNYHNEGSTIIDITDNVYTRTFRTEVQTGTLLADTVIADRWDGPAVFPAGVYAFSAAPMMSKDGIPVLPYLTVTLADGTTASIPAGVATAVTQPFCVRAVLCKSGVFAAGYVYTTTFQLEPYGPTAYEPYACETIEVHAGDTVIAPADGCNVYFTDGGEITVSGLENPASVIDTLRRTVAMLIGTSAPIDAASEPNGGA